MGVEEKKKESKGLLKAAGWIFVSWGAVVTIKGVLDVFMVTPESQFVPVAEWSGKWSPFEIVYGVSCVIAGIICFELVKRKSAGNSTGGTSVDNGAGK